MVFCKSCLSRDYWSTKWKNLCETPIEDLAAFALVLGLTSITYVYGMIWITPVFMTQTDYPIPIKFLLLITPSWIVFGILGNVYYIRKRNSYALKLLPVPFQPADEPTNDLAYTACNIEPSDPLNHRIQDQAAAYGDDADYFDLAAAIEMDKCTTEPSMSYENTVSFAIDDTHWSSCSICKIKVPPRAWHCAICKNCILRRDHHCKFAMACIGEQNHANFLGFLFYLPLGALYAYLLGALYKRDFVDNCPIWLTTLKTLIVFYPMIFEFGFHNILLCVLLQFPVLTFGIFVNYLYLAIGGRTAYDAKKKIYRHAPGQPRRIWYTGLKDFVGSYPWVRILIPCFPAPKVTYDYNDDTNSLPESTLMPDKKLH